MVETEPGTLLRTTQERDAEARAAKLEHVREQVASGELVIRQMTRDERARWADHQAALEARSTPEERARREAALRGRRQRTARFEALER